VGVGLGDWVGGVVSSGVWLVGGGEEEERWRYGIDIIPSAGPGPGKDVKEFS
jgi:hypothetical protein